MKKYLQIFSILALSLVLSACDDEMPTRYGYGYNPLTEGGNPEEVVFVKKAVKYRLPFRFDEAASNREALRDLRNLKEEIIFANCDGRGIVLMGLLDEKTGMLTMDNWYVITPFRSRKFVTSADGEERPILLTRWHLSKGDFYEDVDFDPAKYEMSVTDHDTAKWGGDHMREFKVRNPDEVVK